MRLRAATVLLTLGTVVGCLLVAEAVIRAFDLFEEARTFVAEVEETEPSPDESIPRRRVHPFLGWSVPPGQPAAYRRGSPTIFPDGRPTPWALANAKTNLFGFFSAVDDYRTVEPDRFVVAVFGGSVASNLASLGGDVLVAKLEERFPRLRGSIVVLNFGSGSYKQPQQLILLDLMVLLGVPFDMVVNVDGYNEVALGAVDALAGSHPIFPARSVLRPTLDLLRGDLSGERLELVVSILAERRAVRRIVDAVEARPLLGRSELARALAGLLASRRQREAIELEARFQDLETAGGSETLASLPDACLGERGRCWDLVAELWSRSSLAMAALSERIGASYLHVLQPNQYVAGSKRLSTEELAGAYLPDQPRNRSAREGYPHLSTRGLELREAGIAFHDLTRLFADRSETIYRDSCCHYSLAGNHLLAEAIASLVEVPEGTP